MVGLNITPSDVAAHARGVLVVLSAAEESALKIERYLRNAGYPLRAAWICDLEDLSDALRGEGPDLVLCEADLATAPFTQVAQLCHQHQPDLPLLQISPQVDAESTTTALEAGAQDCVSVADATHLRHLQAVVLREVVNHGHLRELSRVRGRLQEFESRHRQLTEGTSEPFARVQEGILVEGNTAFAKLLGEDDFTDLAGTPFIDLVVADQQNRVKEQLRHAARGKGSDKPVPMTLNHSHGPVEITAQLMAGRADGEPCIEMLVSAPQRGVGAPPQAERGAFLAAMSQPAPEESLRAALLVKIDRYAELEKNVGIVDAEALVGRISDDIRSHLERQDLLTQFSIDELALLINRADIGAIETFAETMRAGIGRKIFTTARHEAQITVSVAVYPLGGGEAADAALQQLMVEARKLSQQDGAGQIQILGATAQQKIQERQNQRVVSEVRAALESGRMKLAYQSISHFEGASSNRFDVLLRMIDETGHEVSAGEFLPQAAKVGMMRAIDRWVLTRIASILVKRQGHQILFTKLSEDSLADAAAFAAWFKKLLVQYPARPESLVIEIPESAIQKHLAKAQALGKQLTALGIGIAVEQYGMEPASLKLLDYVPAEYVKLHPDFGRRFMDHEIQRKLKELLIVTRQRKVSSILAFVEDAGVIAAAWQMGVTFVQGFAIQEPSSVFISSDTPTTGTR